MPTSLYSSPLVITLVILHIITAAAWFGLGLRLAGRARSVLEVDRDAAVALVQDGQHSVWLMNIFIGLTLLFSIGAFIAGGHFDAYGPAYHSAVTLIVILALVQFFVIRPGWHTLHASVTSSEETGPSADDTESARKKVAIGTGVGHLLWLILLGLMFVDNFSQAL